jgi:hypothetical protein
MSFRDFFSDLAEVARGAKVDAINTVLGAGDEDAGLATNDLGDIAKVAAGRGDLVAYIGVAALAYSKALDFSEERNTRIEQGLEGAHERGESLVQETMDRVDPDGVHPEDALRAFSDAYADGMMVSEDKTPEYRDSFHAAAKALEEVREPTSFSELEHQQQAVEAGFGAQVAERCEAEWGYPSAAEAREAGVIDPLLPSAEVATPAAPDRSETEPRTTGPDPNTPEPEQQTTDGTEEHDLEVDDPVAEITADDELAATPAGAAETNLADPATSPQGAAETDLDTELQPALEIADPTTEHGEPYATGDGDLAAQDLGHDAWVEAEAAEDAALAASVEAVDEPTGYDDPETYSSDGDMAALTEAYDWEAEQFDEGATLFDEPALDATVITAEQAVTVPDAEVRDPDEPEV